MAILQLQPGEALAGTGTLYIASLIARLSRSGHAPVLRYQGRDTTAAELLAAIFRYARALADISIERGSLVAQFAPNCPDALAIRYAANLLGAAAVYLSAPPSPERRAELLAQIDPELLVLFPETAHLLPGRVKIRVAAVGAAWSGASLRLDELAAAQTGDPVPSLALPGDLAVIVSSGGTTGVPKGSWRDFAAYTAMVDAPSPADRRQLVNGHLAYLSQVLVDITLLGGGSVVLEDAYEAADTLATIEAERITDLFLVEPQLFEVMDHPISRVGTCRRCGPHAIGASAPPTLRRRARERLGRRAGPHLRRQRDGDRQRLPPAEYDPAHPERFTSPAASSPASRSGSAATTARSRRPGKPAASRCARPRWRGVTATCRPRRRRPSGRLVPHRRPRAPRPRRLSAHPRPRGGHSWIDGVDGEPDPGRGHVVPLADVRYAVAVVDHEAGHLDRRGRALARLVDGPGRMPGSRSPHSTDPRGRAGNDRAARPGTAHRAGQARPRGDQAAGPRSAAPGSLVNRDASRRLSSWPQRWSAAQRSFASKATARSKSIRPGAATSRDAKRSNMSLSNACRSRSGSIAPMTVGPKIARAMLAQDRTHAAASAVRSNPPQNGSGTFMASRCSSCSPANRPRSVNGSLIEAKVRGWVGRVILRRSCGDSRPASSISTKAFHSSSPRRSALRGSPAAMMIRLSSFPPGRNAVARAARKRRQSAAASVATASREAGIALCLAITWSGTSGGLRLNQCSVHEFQARWTCPGGSIGSK